MNHAKLVSELIALRKDWTIQDFKDAYGDLECEPGSREWEVVPDTLEECFEKMEEYLFHCYTSNYIQECIEDEKGFEGNYSSIHSFVEEHYLSDEADKVFGKGWEAENDIEQIQMLVGDNYLVKPIDEVTKRDERADDYIQVIRL